jgi:acyl carrier protein
MEYAQEIRNFVLSNFAFGDDVTFQDDSSFFEKGIIDSTGVLELIVFMESTYGIKIQDEEMIPENLDTVNRAARFVARKIANVNMTQGGQPANASVSNLQASQRDLRTAQ